MGGKTVPVLTFYFVKSHFERLKRGSRRVIGHFLVSKRRESYARELGQIGMCLVLGKFKLRYCFCIICI